MNHLAHFLLAYPDPQLMVGGFLGDFTRGRLKGDYPRRVEQGIALHRAIDAFTDQHARTRESRERFEPAFRRYAGIMCDVIYDHFLAENWHQFNELTLAGFADLSYQSVLEEPGVPAPARRTIERMRQLGSLERYAEEAFIERALTHIGSRFKHRNPLDQGFPAYKDCEAGLREDFVRFMPELQSFVSQHTLVACESPDKKS